MKPVLVVLKIVVSLALIAWVMSSTDLSSVGEALGQASMPFVLAAAAVHLISFLLLNVRWWLLLVHLIPILRLRDTVAGFWLGLFGNNILPSGMGGDVLRIVRLRSPEVSGRSLLASVLMDRAVGLMGVLMIGLVALLAVAEDLMPAWSRWLIIGLLIAIPGGLLVFFSGPVVALLNHLERRFENTRAIVLGIHTLQRLQDYRDEVPRLFAALGLTLVLQSLVAFCYVLLGWALGAEIPVSAYFLTIPLLFIAVNLPISVGGLGVREGVFVTLMATFGMDSRLAVGISVLYLAVLLALTLPGALVLIKERPDRSQAVESED